MRVAGVEGGYAVGLGDAGGVQEDRLDDAEDGGVGAYSEGEGEDGDEGEGGGVPELAQPVTDISQHICILTPSSI